MKKILILLSMIVIVGCSAKLDPLYLEAVEGDVSSDKTIIANYLRDELYIEGDIESELKLSSLKAEGYVEVEFYKTDLDYAWHSGIAVVKDHEVLSVLNAMTNEDMLLADINSDGSYDLILQGSIGSGILTNIISVYDIKNNKNYDINLVKDNNLIKLIYEENILFVYEFYRSFDRMAKDPIGYLKIKDGELILESKE